MRGEAEHTQLHDDFQRDGVVCVRGAFSPDDVALVERGIERNLAEPSERSAVASRPDDPGRFFEDFCNWQRIPEFEQFIRESPAAVIAAELMGSSEVRLFHDHLLVKEPGTQQRTPWHQDQPYYNVEGFDNCSMWMPVDPVDRASTVEFVAGSHRGPWLMPRTFMDDQAKWFPEGSLQELPDIEADRGAFEILAWELEPGDALFFHMLTLHASGGATTAGGRSRCGSSATTRRMRPARGRRRRSSRVWPTNCPPARRWTTRSSPSSRSPSREGLPGGPRPEQGAEVGERARRELDRRRLMRFPLGTVRIQHVDAGLLYPSLSVPVTVLIDQN